MWPLACSSFVSYMCFKKHMGRSLMSVCVQYAHLGYLTHNAQHAV